MTASIPGGPDSVPFKGDDLAERISDNRRYGKAAASLGVSGKIFANGVIPNKTLEERSAIVDGMIDGYLEAGRWKTAAQLVYGNETAKALYSGNLDLLDQKILDVFKPKDLPDSETIHDPYHIIQLLATKGRTNLILNMAMTPGINYNVSLGLLHSIGKKLDDNLYAEKINQIAANIEAENPKEAYRLYKSTKNIVSISNLYKKLIDKFSLDKTGILLEIAGDPEATPYSEKKGALKEIILLALKSGEENKFGKILYDIANTNALSFETKDLEDLEHLAAKQLSRYELRHMHGDWYTHGSKSPYQHLELKWAKLHFEEEPIFSYELFVKHNYKGRERTSAARLAFEKMNPQNLGHFSGDRVAIIEEDLRKLYKHIPKNKMWLKEMLAVELDDKKGLVKLSEIYEVAGNKERAYYLRFIGSEDKNETKLNHLRNGLVQATITEQETKDFGCIYFNWLHHED